MHTLTKSAVAAAVLITFAATAFGETGRPTDHVAAIHLHVVDRQADDALARYEMIVDGAHRNVIDHRARTVDHDHVDSYAKYLMVIDGASRAIALDRSRAR
jgi:hypothetical protein